MMNLFWKSRILLGPMRPFLAAKLLDGASIAVDRLRFGSMYPTRITEALHTRSGLFPLPSKEWFAQHSPHVLRFARSMRDGKINRYGITTWVVGQTDPADVDVRAILELSRMHHWCAYALAAHIEPDRAEEWAGCFEREVAAFHAAYTSRACPQWAHPMDVGLRAVSMLVAWDWIRRTGYENIDTDRIIAARAIDHGLVVFLRRESRGGLSTSHYSANLLGLLAVDAYVTGSHGLPKWSGFVRSEIHRELQRQFLPDGMVQEGSTGYHKHVVDIFMMAARLLVSADGTLHRDFIDTLGRGLAALDAIEQVGMPLIGDNDDGMAMKPTGFDPTTDFLRDVAAQLGIEALPGKQWTSLPAFGLDIYNAPLSLTLRNGDVGQFGKGGHAHHDQNSITVSIGGRHVIVDPGSSQYTVSAKDRNTQRSVQRHATMWPDDLDQGCIERSTGGLFWLPAFDIQHNVLERSEFSWKGLVRHRRGIAHTRTLMRSQDGRSISCVDELSAANTGDVHGSVRFPLAPDAHVQVQDGIATIHVNDVTLELLWQGASHTVEEIEIAPAYGTSIRSQMLVLRGSRITWSLRMG
jgi:hypothetical protein